MSDGGVRLECDTLTACMYAENDRKQKEAPLFNRVEIAANASLYQGDDAVLGYSLGTD